MFEVIKMTRGQLLKRLRLEHGYTQKEVAAKMGVHFSTIMKYEKDQIRMTSETLEKLASIYGVQTADLFDVNSETSIDPFKSVKSAVAKTKSSTGISDYSNLPDEIKSFLISATLEALHYYYNSLQDD